MGWQPAVFKPVLAVFAGLGIDFRVAAARISGARCRLEGDGSMLTLSRITKAYAGRVLFADATLQLNRDDRIGLVGPNGAGKTTLFSIILGQEPPDEGKITFERGISFGYLPQENAPVGDETVIELATGITPEYIKLRRILKAWDSNHPIEALHPEEIHDDVHDRFNQLGGYRL